MQPVSKAFVAHYRPRTCGVRELQASPPKIMTHDKGRAPLPACNIRL